MQGKLAAGSSDRRSSPPVLGSGVRSPSQKTVLSPFGQPVPRSGAAAIRAEMEADLEAAVRLALLIWPEFR